MPQSRGKDPNEIGALWVKSGNRGEYMTGIVNRVRVVCFRVNANSDKAPDWRVLKSQPRDGQAPSTQRLDDRADAQPRASRVDDIEVDDIPW